jgi:integrase
MASARKLPSGRYQGRYRDARGEERTLGRTFAHKAEALRLAAEEEAKSRRAGYRDPNASRQTWGQWCERWWPTRGVEASTVRTDTGRRDRYLMPKWRDVPLAEITRQDVRAWAAELRLPGVEDDGTVRKPPGPSTVQRIVTLFSASLSAAVDAEILPANPAARLRLSTASQGTERYLTHEEAQAVLEQLDGEDRRAAMLLLGTGLRWGEAAGLHTWRVDVARRSLLVAETWVPEAHAMKAYPKGRRIRHVPVPDWLLVEIAKAPKALSCPHEHTTGRCRSGLVLASPGGQVMDGSAFRKAWTAAVKAAGIGHARVHDARHTYASWQIQGGVSLAEVGRLLGHVSPLTTQRYAHLAETPSDRVLAALPNPTVRATPVPQRGAI